MSRFFCNKFWLGQVLGIGISLGGFSIVLGQQCPIKEEAVKVEKKKALKVGDLLPLSGLPKVWLQGQPINQWEQDRVYIFEFWATWCRPCLAEMPHLEGIHERLVKDGIKATVVGVNVFDQQTPEQVKKFLAKQATKLTYTIAMESEKDGNVRTHWLNPLSVSGIPFALAVKNGKILWTGHPKQLNSSFIIAMTDKKFVPGTTPKQLAEAETTQVRQQMAHIQKLYNEQKWTEAEVAAHAFFENAQIDEQYKWSVASLPIQVAFAVKDYTKANAYLRRKADLFPNSADNLMQVATLVVEAEAVPVEERDLAVALMCTEKSCKMLPNNPHIWAVQAKLFEMHGDKEKAIESMTEAIRCEKPSRLLAQTAELSDSKESLLPMVKEILEERAENQKARVQEDLKRQFVPAKSTTEESQKILSFLAKYPMVQGDLPKFLPKNQLYFFEIWRAPSNLSVGSLMWRRPGRWFVPAFEGTSAQIMILSVGDDKLLERNRLALQNSKYSTSCPVCLIPMEELKAQFFTPYKMDITQPLAFAVRDGQVLWSGNPQDLPAWVREEATLPNYDHAKAQIKHKEIQVQQQEVWQILCRAMQAKTSQEALELLIPYEAQIKQNSGLFSTYQEIKIGIPYQAKDYVGIGKICLESLKTFPNDNYIADRTFKILMSNAEIRDANLSVAYAAVIQMAQTKGKNWPYISACWMVVANMAKEQQDYSLCRFAAEEAKKTTEYYHELIRLTQQK